jgi:hypothetical protein
LPELCVSGWRLSAGLGKVAAPEKQKTGEPFVIDEESLVSLLELLREEIRNGGRPAD